MICHYSPRNILSYHTRSPWLKSKSLLLKSLSIRHVTLLWDRFPTDNAARYRRTSRCYPIGNCQPQLLLSEEFDGADVAACLRGVFSAGESGMGISRFDSLVWGMVPIGFFIMFYTCFATVPRVKVRRPNKIVILVARNVFIRGTGSTTGNTPSVDAASRLAPPTTVRKMP